MLSLCGRCLTTTVNLTRVYKDKIAPYFTTEAMEFIVSLGIKHLLVDLPSIDRMSDEGKLSNHRIFWNVDQGSFVTNPVTRKNSTITELIYVPTRWPGRRVYAQSYRSHHLNLTPVRAGRCSLK